MKNTLFFLSIDTGSHIYPLKKTINSIYLDKAVMKMETEQHGSHIAIVPNSVVYNRANNGLSRRTRLSIESKFELSLRKGSKATKEHKKIEKIHELRHGFAEKTKGV